GGGKSETKDVATPGQHCLGEIESILRAEHGETFAILGRHPVQVGAERAIAVRAFLPRANEVTVLLENGGVSYPARRIHPDGFFEAVIHSSAAILTSATWYVLYRGY